LKFQPSSKQRSRMSPLPEHPIRDRFAEFQCIALAKGTLHEQTKGDLLPQDQPQVKVAWHKWFGKHAQHVEAASKSGFMHEFFQDVDDLQGKFSEGNKSVSKIAPAVEELMQATTAESEEVVNDRLAAVIEKASSNVQAAKSALDKLRRWAPLQDTAQERVRANLIGAMSNKYQQLLVAYQSAQVDARKALEERHRRELHLLCPEATHEQLEQMLSEGTTAVAQMQVQMAGTHHALLEEVHRVREKHMDILRLEAKLEEVHKMMQEIALLVDSQGELLDIIEHNVHHTVEVTKKANEELNTTVKLQRSTRKWSCCLLFALLIAVAIIALPATTFLSSTTSAGASTALVGGILLLLLAAFACCCYCKFCRSSCFGGCFKGGKRSFKRMPELPA